MTSESYVMNGYNSPTAYQDTQSMSTALGVNGNPVPASSLLDPRAFRNSTPNGKSTIFPFSVSSQSSSRSVSEPPCGSVSAQVPTSSSRLSKDDAYNVFEHQGHKRKPPHTNSQAPTPQQLLNPKNFYIEKRRKDEATKATSSHENKTSEAPTHSPDFIFASTAPEDTRATSSEPEGLGMGSLIEKVHNVEKREDRPQKKQKTEHVTEDTEENKPKATFAGGGKGGEIGEYMRQKREEAHDQSGPTSTVVDLTADDEDVVVVSDTGDKEVCYGRLDSTKVSAHSVPTPDPKATYTSKTDWPTMKLQLRRFPGNNYFIRVLDPSGKDFGNIDVRTSVGLAPLMDTSSPKVRVQARLNTRKKKLGQMPGEPISEYLDMHINLYGPKRCAISIGRFLSQKQLYLRTPYAIDRGIELHNPHTVKDTTLPRTTLPGASNGTGYATRTVEEIRHEVLGMFDSLEKSENLPEMQPDPRIITPLLSHQKQGLYFMSNKEKARVYSDKEEDNSSLWRLKMRSNGQRVYVNIITGKEERTKPPEVLGGILADMMGLGKTLSILSLVVGSLEESHEWAKEMPSLPPFSDDAVLKRNSKTTLLVSPLSTIANWEEQINTHIQPGTLSFYVYHGNNRCQNLEALSEFDMVITTYSIISSEFSRRSKKRDSTPLLETNFFRIVLDEAHMIREQSTRQSQAICTLSAQRRWTVTGTPVQNRLDDLGALIKFLRVKPFHEKGGFTQFILSPFKNADPEILPKLRLLVDSITLRRLKDRIDLPPRKDEIIRLEFSKEERHLYEWFAKDSDNKMKIIAGEQKKSLGGKSYVHILQAILRLRLLCAHGKELLGEEDLKLTEGLSSMNAIDLDDESNNSPTMTTRQAYELLMLLRETDADTCVQCARKIEPNEEAVNGKDEIIGYMLPCYQVVCKDCHVELQKTVQEQANPNNQFTCPFCEQSLRFSLLELTLSGLEAAEEARSLARQNPRQAKTLGRYGGPHTKTSALVAALLQSRAESQAVPSEAPIKSVVFSGWTAHLDLIQIALEDHGLKYVRLDGKMSRPQRTASLDAFRDDPSVPIILVSIMAGGLGLNLTAGSRVYVMEPQFNPAAEAQAVDRVHRLGQKRDVVTTRFIMADSFEEKMLDLQRKKQSLADLSLGKGRLDKAEATKRRLEELRSLFK